MRRSAFLLAATAMFAVAPAAAQAKADLIDLNRKSPERQKFSKGGIEIVTMGRVEEVYRHFFQEKE